MLYEVAHPLVSWVARWCCSLEVVGRDRVPAHGGVIVAANHVSYLDIPIVGCSLARRADFLAKAELFANPAVGWLFKRLGGVPIRRDGVDRTALGDVERRLAAGHVVVMYPEGTRSPDERLRDPKPGVGMLAVHTGVPVVPAYIAGTGEAWPPGARWLRSRPITVVFGEPMRWGTTGESATDEIATKRRYQQVSQEIMGRIAELQHEAQTRRLRLLHASTAAR